MILRGVVLLVVLASGAVLMSLEAAGVRLIEGNFGSGIHVWGSMISVFLSGLALGAVLGGKLADRRPAAWKLALLLLVGGGMAMVVPAVSEPVVDWMSRDPGQAAGYEEVEGFEGLNVRRPRARAWWDDERYRVLAAATALFFVPSLLLGTVSPYAAKLLIHRLGRLGSGVGKISGLSTFGGIVGVLVTTFYLLGLGIRLLIFLNGLALAALALLLILAEVAARRKVPPGA